MLLLNVLIFLRCFFGIFHVFVCFFGNFGLFLVFLCFSVILLFGDVILVSLSFFQRFFRVFYGTNIVVFMLMLYQCYFFIFSMYIFPIMLFFFIVHVLPTLFLHIHNGYH